MTKKKLIKPNDDDLEIIRKIENLLRRNLVQVEKIEWDTRGYAVDDDGAVVGLGFWDCTIRLPELTLLAKVLPSLRNLLQLYMRDNFLTDVSELHKLTNLTHLDLSGNQLTDISELRKLTNLTHLDLSNNKLTNISVLEKLMKLTYLYLSHNNLTNISVLEELTKLTHLYLSNNKLTDISGLNKLTKLKRLSLNKNAIREMPEWITQMRMEIYCDNDIHKEGISLKNNPLETPPVEIVEQGQEAIVDYFSSIDAGTVHLGEAKVVLVGQGAVGKTSLVKRLIYNDFNPEENETDGIRINEWNLHVDNKDIKLNVWDFGGQEIIHATHQFFLTKRSLYLLVLDSRLDEYNNRLEYWLRLIQTSGGDSPIIIVGNKCDQKPLDIDKFGLKRRYPAIKAIMETSCLNRAGIDELKDCMKQELMHLPHIESPIPVKWKKVKDKLEKMDDSFTTYGDYENICDDCGVTDNISKVTLINFLHDLGTVLNFHDDTPLKETNILNPEWVTDGVYSIITNKKIFGEKGIFSRDELYSLLPDDKYPVIKGNDTKSFILSMMEKFELCYKFEKDAKAQYLIPDLLPKQEMDTGDWGNFSRFVYSYDVLPLSIISRLITRVHEIIKKDVVWRTGVLLKKGYAESLVRMDKEKKTITVLLRGEDNDRKVLLEKVLGHLDDIQSSFSSLKYTRKISIPGKPMVMVNYDHLKNLKRMGIDKFVPEGLQQTYDVNELLNSTPGSSMQTRQTTLRIQKVKIENMCCFKKIELDLTNNDWTLLLGDNAAGKTTILRAIALGLCDQTEATSLIEKHFRGAIHNKNRPALIEIGLGDADGYVGSIKTELKYENDEVEVTQTVDPDVIREKIFICGYGAARGVLGAKNYEEYRTIDAVGTLFDYEQPLQNPLFALINLRDLGGAPYDEWLRKIDDVLAIEPYSTKISSNKITVSGPWGKDYSLEKLADGYHFTCAFLFDMMGWEALFHRKKFTADMEGIVIIDEIEQHLHPKWQREIISRLYEQFPNVQFIVTTHSPLIVGAMNSVKGSALVIENNNGKSTINNQSCSVKGWVVDQILTSNSFGLSTAQDLATEKLVSEYANLLNEFGPEDEDVKRRELELARLEKRVRSDVRIDEDIWKFVLDATRDRIKKLPEEERKQMIARLRLSLHS